MKGLSVLVSILLLLFANALAAYLKQTGALPVSGHGGSRVPAAAQNAAQELVGQASPSASR